MSRTMGAYIKTIPIHDIEGISACQIYITDEEKSTIEITNENGVKYKVWIDLENNIIDTDAPAENREQAMQVMNYIRNPGKIILDAGGDKIVLESGHNCEVDTAVFEFESDRHKYELNQINKGNTPHTNFGLKKDGTAKEARNAYHLIMSFAERDDLSKLLVHRIGLEFCERALTEYRATVVTHVKRTKDDGTLEDTKHIHNHILFNAYKMNGLTKYRDTKDQLQELREIVNEISKEYGIEISIDSELDDVTQVLEAERKGHSHAEYTARKHGYSWKANLQDTITAVAREVAASDDKSWNHFEEALKKHNIEVLFNKSGKLKYKVTLENGENREALAHKLGYKFMQPSIQFAIGEITEEEALSRLAEMNIYRKNKDNDNRIDWNEKYTAYKNEKIFVARYTVTGRRRSDLELLFLGAKKLIERNKGTRPKKDVVDKYRENKTVISLTAEKKAEKMLNSSNYVFGLGIRDLDHLKEIMQKCSQDKKEAEIELKRINAKVSATKETASNIQKALELKAQIENKGLSVNMQLLFYSDEQVQDVFKADYPSTSKQHKQIISKIKELNKGLQTFPKVTELSYTEAREILDYLNNKTSIKPSTLLTAEEAAERKEILRLEKKYAGILQNVYGHEPASEDDLSLISKITYGKPEFAYTPTSEYEARRILRFLQPGEPLLGKLASEKEIKHLKKALSEDGITIELQRKHITKEELVKVEQYARGVITDMPSALIKDNKISKAQALDLEALLNDRKIDCHIPIEELSQKDFNSIMDYILNKGNAPEFFTDEKAFDKQRGAKNLAFDKAIEGFSLEDKKLLYNYRAVLNDLRKAGITEDKFSSALLQIEDYNKEYERLNNNVKDLNLYYKNLSILKRNAEYAMDMDFCKDIKLGFDMEQQEKEQPVKTSSLAEALKQKEASKQPDTEVVNPEPKKVSTEAPKPVEQPKSETVKPVEVAKETNKQAVTEAPKIVLKKPDISAENKAMETVQNVVDNGTKAANDLVSSEQDNFKELREGSGKIVAETTKIIFEKILSGIIEAKCDGEKLLVKNLTSNRLNFSIGKNTYAFEPNQTLKYEIGKPLYNFVATHDNFDSVTVAKEKTVEKKPVAQPQQPAPTPVVVKKPQKVYDKDGISAILSEDGLSITFSNNKDTAVTVESDVLHMNGKFAQIKVYAGDELTMDLWSPEIASGFTKELQDGRTIFREDITADQIPESMMVYIENIFKISGKDMVDDVVQKINNGRKAYEVFDGLISLFESLCDKDFGDGIRAKFKYFNDELFVELINESGKDINFWIADEYVIIPAGETVTYSENTEEFKYLACIKPDESYCIKMETLIENNDIKVYEDNEILHLKNKTHKIMGIHYEEFVNNVNPGDIISFPLSNELIKDFKNYILSGKEFYNFPFDDDEQGDKRSIDNNIDISLDDN